MIRSEFLPFLGCTVFALLVGVTSFMSPDVYSSWWWFALWTLVTAAVVAVIFRTRMWRRIPLFILHLSMVVILVGGGTTALTSVRGTLHLRPSESSSVFVSDTGARLPLPATLTLESFTPEYYPGMSFPKDFRSKVLSSDGSVMDISMNRIGKLDGYRFYQTSFDNEGGTVLTVSHDPAGIAITYFGFLLFAVGGALLLFKRFFPNTFLSRGWCVILILLASGAALPASATPAVSEVIADSLAVRQVVFNGRVVPFNTMATVITLKLTGRPEVGRLSPERFIASLMAYPEEWGRVAFIKIKSRPLREALHVGGDYVSLQSLYDGNDYVPGRFYKGGAGELDDAILRLDEKISILMDLWSGRLFTSVNDRADLRPDFSIKAEIAYNRLMPVRIEFIASVVLALIALVAMFIKLRRMLCIMVFTAAMSECLVFVWLWYISGTLPVSDVPRIMQFIGTAVTVLTAFITYKKYSPLLSALTLLAAAFLFLVSWLGVKDPHLSPLMPVLASPWLAVHVSVVMTAYAVLGITFPIAIAALAVPKERGRLSALSQSLLLLGTYLLGLGIIVGAMWANVSWGRYWAWDPKETWALVTLMLYAIPMHRSFGMQMRHKIYNLYILFAFLSIVMTYAGVNSLSSLHAYN